MRPWGNVIVRVRTGWRTRDFLSVATRSSPHPRTLDAAGELDHCKAAHPHRPIRYCLNDAPLYWPPLLRALLTFQRSHRHVRLIAAQARQVLDSQGLQSHEPSLRSVDKSQFLPEVDLSYQSSACDRTKGSLIAAHSWTRPARRPIRQPFDPLDQSDRTCWPLVSEGNHSKPECLSRPY